MSVADQPAPSIADDLRTVAHEAVLAARHENNAADRLNFALTAKTALEALELAPTSPTSREADIRSRRLGECGNLARSVARDHAVQRYPDGSEIPEHPDDGDIVPMVLLAGSQAFRARDVLREELERLHNMFAGQGNQVAERQAYRIAAVLRTADDITSVRA